MSSPQSNKKPIKILLICFILLFIFGLGYYISMKIYSTPEKEPKHNNISYDKSSTKSLKDEYSKVTSNTDNSNIEKSELISWDFTSVSSSLDSLTTRNYGSDNLSDGDITTTWSEGESGDGIGSWIQLFSNTEFIISKLQLKNGYKKSKELFFKNNRAKKIKVEFSEGESSIWELSDGFSFDNTLTLDSPITTTSLKLTILEVYEGSTYKDTCISELLVYGFPAEIPTMNNSTTNTDIVNIKDIDNTIIVDLKYATEDNFTKQKVYTSDECFLRRKTAEKLSSANRELRTLGYTIKIWDGYRPLEVQKLFWKLVPDSRYVAHPDKGSRHNRGASVDITLVNNSTDEELKMPSSFDEFSEKAWRNSSSMSKKEKLNLELLTDVMIKHGFSTINTEWWHFDDIDWRDYKLK
ncbi:NADase-type glycan-binding domain-containing protein [Oceanirhabdus seepicola]|uniref:D-alanyl-D-alanine dipeptidase n=1 Tax=Oceanirhabdus seepicola TaxID=2828781 RepID=A0A9J6P855_9CLOT|nr:M15 family metallopeptidase [Oceanirhabdus seepicola]MCM1991624.1 D-alanyl-D-alanine carboxypeptidase family protein [Oceanirhabdus seepicola]